MSRRLNSLQDVVDWGFCVGCGACAYACLEHRVTLINIPDRGILPKIQGGGCQDCTECLSFCPGAGLTANAPLSAGRGPWDHLIGPTLGIWEGYATDEEIRFRGSSGGVLTALSIYGLEKEGINFILHTAADPEKPWFNRTVISSSPRELLERTGSRYSPSSPCDGLKSIELSATPGIFIGRPCDAAAASMLRRKNSSLQKNLGLILTFFCAGPPGAQATLNLLNYLEIAPETVKDLRYRGMGWPGSFRVSSRNGKGEKTLSYEESWGKLAKHPRSFRCHLCPDGLGELADISCGDAWHRHDKSKPSPGISIVVARTPRGKEILRQAMEAGYLYLEPSGPEEVIRAQGMVERRKELRGRLSALKLFLIPSPRFSGFYLEEAWRKKPLAAKARTVLGTIKRIWRRKLWRPNRNLPC